MVISSLFQIIFQTLHMNIGIRQIGKAGAGYLIMNTGSQKINGCK